MNWRQLLKRVGSFLVLLILMTLLFVVGATYWGPQIAGTLSPDEASFAGLAMLAVCTIDTLLLGTFILAACIYGWRLMLITALLFYGVKTFQASIVELSLWVDGWGDLPVATQCGAYTFGCGS